MNKFKIILFFLFVSLSVSSIAQKNKKANKDTEKWRYELACAGVGVKGTYLVKVWSYSKRPKVALEQAKKNAIHGIIFRGFVGSNNGCSTQKPLTRNPALEQEKKIFFKDFFADGGKYMKFVHASTEGSHSHRDVVKLKGKYKVGVIVSVNKDLLRKDLENANIIQGLSSRF